MDLRKRLKLYEKYEDQPVLDDQENPMLDESGNPVLEPEVDPNDVISGAFEAQQQAQESERERLAKLPEQHAIEDLGVVAGEGVDSLVTAGLAPLQGIADSAFVETQDPLAKSLAARKPLDLRSRVMQQRKQDEDLASRDIDLRQRMGMQPLEEMKTRVALDRQFKESAPSSPRMYTKAVTMRDGSSRILTVSEDGRFFEPGTGNDVSMEVQGPAYAPGMVVNPVTNEPNMLNRSTGTVDKVFKDAASDQQTGESPFEYKQRKDLEQSGKKRMQDANIDSQIEFKTQMGELAKMSDLEADALALYDAAKLTGPLKGRVTQLADRYGFTVDAPAQAAQQQILNWANEYIKRISGAAVPVQEFEERFRPLLPSIAQDRAKFRASFENFKRAIERDAGAIRARYGKSEVSASPAQVPSAPSAAPTRRVITDPNDL